MRGSISGEANNVHIVEVFARSSWTRVKLRITIDGKKIAGEDF